MHIVFVTESWPPQVNGVALTVQTLARGMATRGHRVEVVRPGTDGRDGGIELVPARRAPLLYYRGLQIGRQIVLTGPGQCDVCFVSLDHLTAVTRVTCCHRNIGPPPTSALHMHPAIGRIHTGRDPASLRPCPKPRKRGFVAWLLGRCLVPVLLLAALLAGCRQPPEAVSVTCRLPARSVLLGSPEGIDNAHLDPVRHHIYVARDGGIDVWSADNGAPIGRIRDVDGANGIATAPALHRGFALDSTNGTISVFDLDTLEVIGRISNGNPSSGIVYDAATRTLAVGSADAREVRLIDGAAGTVTGDAPLAGGSAKLRARGNGALYVRVKQPARVVRIDLATRQLDTRWPSEACNVERDLASR